MDQLCRTHGDIIESINENGQPMCRQCNQQTKEIVDEYIGKKKSLLKKKQKEVLEQLRQSKKRMVEVQENLELKMKSHFENVEKKREQILGFFSEQEKMISNYINQGQDFVNFKNGNRMFQDKNSKDSTFKKVEEQQQIISQLEQEYNQILAKANTDYINSVGNLLLQEQNQQQVQQQHVQQQQQTVLQTSILEQIAFKDFNTLFTKGEKLDLMIFNRDNNIIAYSDGFEIKFVKIIDDQLLKIDNTIQDDDMELIQCILFGNQNNDMYYGTDEGKLKIFKFQDDNWSSLQQIETHDKKAIMDLQISENDSRLFSAGMDKTIKIWQKVNDNWNNIKTFENKDFNQMCSIAFDSTSNYLISCSFTQIQIWNINDADFGQAINGLEPYKDNKIYFINDRMFFVAGQDQFYFYEKNEQQKFQQVQNNILPQNKKYQQPICYNPQLQLILLQNSESQNVEVLKFNNGKFNHQSLIQGVYNKLQIANNASYLMLLAKNIQNELKVMEIIGDNQRQEMRKQ